MAGVVLWKHENTFAATLQTNLRARNEIFKPKPLYPGRYIPTADTKTLHDPHIL